MKYILLLAALILPNCTTPSQRYGFEDPAKANICVAYLLGVEPLSTLPVFIVKPGIFWDHSPGYPEPALVYGTYHFYSDTLIVADGYQMANTVIHETGHRYGLNEDDAENLISRVDECPNRGGIS